MYNYKYDITFIDIPIKKFHVNNQLAQELNEMYLLQNKILKLKTGYHFEEKKYYYSSGILCLSTYLKNRNLTVAYINYPKDKEKLKDIILASRCVGFSTVTITIQTILELSKQIKKINPLIKIFLGGYHASYFAKELLEENQYIDSIIIGEGEIALYQLLSGVEKSKIEGLAYRKSDDSICINEKVHFLSGEEIPSPDFSLIEDDLNDYNIYIGTMRGCIGKCNFCVNHNYWGKPRYISRNNLETTFQYLDTKIHSTTLIHIIDNVFTLNYRKLEEFKNIVSPYKTKFVFECDTLASLINKEKINILKDMNIIKIALGFEDCVDEINRKANKNVNIIDNIKAAKMIRKYAPDICVYAYWLIGLPGTSIDSIKRNKRTIKYLIAREIVHIISPKIFIPYPGTVFWEKREKYNLCIVSKNWDQYERVSPPYPYVLDNINGEQLEKAFNDIVELCNEGYIQKWNLNLIESRVNAHSTWYENE